MAQRRDGRPQQPTSGGARLKAAGKRAMLLGWPPEEAAAIEPAAKEDGRPMSQFVMHHALVAAKRILKKSE